MNKKIILVLLLLIPFLFLQCGDDDYEVDYDDEKVQFKAEGDKIIFKNNLDVPVVLDNIKVNDKEVKSYIKYKTCDYVKYRDEVVINYNDKSNQVIHLTSIVLPGKRQEFDYKLKKEDEVELEFYPVTYMFLSDNVYFLNKKITENEVQYRLYLNEDIKKLNINKLKDKNNINKINGIMIFVKEYEILEDTFEELDFEVQ